VSQLFTDMEALLECVLAELETLGVPVCDSFIYPGEVPLDRCHCKTDECSGMAWIRPVGSWPSNVFPQQSRDLRKCGLGTATRLGAGVARCLSGLSVLGQKKIIDSALITGDSAQLVEDMGAVYQAITCCALEGEPDMVIDQWLPVTGGDCYGGEWTFWLSSDIRPTESL
jgi:hypothetical protein